MPVFGNYGLYLIISLPGILLGLWAQMRVKSAFKKYSQVGLSNRMSGSQVARRILDSQGLSNVRVERVSGFLSDHYDPSAKVLRLSPDVHDGLSVAAAGVAAHEAGHALQDKNNYAPLRLRSAIVPAVQFGSWLGPAIFIAGFVLSGLIGQFGIMIAYIGVGLFAMTAAFSIVTLPVEFDASKRAKQLLATDGYVLKDELRGVDRVLDAAALTYVAAAIQAVMTLLYYVMLLTGRRR